MNRGAHGRFLSSKKKTRRRTKGSKSKHSQTGGNQSLNSRILYIHGGTPVTAPPSLPMYNPLFELPKHVRIVLFEINGRAFSKLDGGYIYNWITKTILEDQTSNISALNETIIRIGIPNTKDYYCTVYDKSGMTVPNILFNAVDSVTQLGVFKFQYTDPISGALIPSYTQFEHRQGGGFDTQLNLAASDTEFNNELFGKSTTKKNIYNYDNNEFISPVQDLSEVANVASRLGTSKQKTQTMYIISNREFQSPSIIRAIQTLPVRTELLKESVVGFQNMKGHVEAALLKCGYDNQMITHFRNEIAKLSNNLGALTHTNMEMTTDVAKGYTDLVNYTSNVVSADKLKNRPTFDMYKKYKGDIWKYITPLKDTHQGTNDIYSSMQLVQSIGMQIPPSLSISPPKPAPPLTAIQQPKLHVKGFIMSAYYDVFDGIRHKRILFLGEMHEYDNDINNLETYIEQARVWISDRSNGKHCLDVHLENKHVWAPILDKNYIGGSDSNLNTISSAVALQFAHTFNKGKVPGMRIHGDDLRGFGNFGADLPDNINYTHQDFDFNADELLAISFGVGPFADQKGGIIKKYLEKFTKRWDKVPGFTWGNSKLTWSQMMINKSRGRKTLLLFLKEHPKVTMGDLYPVMKAVIEICASRGWLGSIWIRRQFGYGWEGLNDIYSFLRMFRTFNNKRTTPCMGGYQHNIIYISQVNHSLSIMFMMRKIFGFVPTSFDSVDDGKQLVPSALGYHKTMTKSQQYVDYNDKLNNITRQSFTTYGNRYLNGTYFPYPMSLI